MTTGRWRIRLGRIAEQDIQQIFVWTHDRFGLEQARRYRGFILDAIRALAEGPDVLGARDVPDVAPGVKLLHIARNGRRGRHLLLYKVEGDERIVIGRVLHDAMDFERHWPDDDWL